MPARSLQARLTTLFAGAAAAVLAATAAVLLAQLRAGLVDAVDAAARDRARDVAALAASHRLSALGSLPGAPEAVVQVVGPTGQVVASSDNVAGLGPLFSFGPSAGTRSVGQVGLLHDTVDYRVVAMAQEGLVVYAGAPVDDVQDGVNVLAARLAVGGPVLLAVLVGGVWLLVGRALRPVEVLRREAAAIPAADLSRRVPVPSELELARLARTLNDLLARVQDAARQQRGFVDDAAHELRNPVAALLAALEVHERTSDDPLAPAMAAQARRLSKLITDLLALARLDAGSDVAPRPVELGQLVREELLVRSGVTSDLAKAWVLADPALLSRAVANLLDNAQRHARARVHVQAGVSDGAAVLRVIDDGPGLAVADRERVFTRFTRLDGARSRDAGGSGLGLAIVAGIVASAGGSIAIVDSSSGAEFVVRLPLYRR